MTTMLPTRDGTAKGGWFPLRGPMARVEDQWWHLSDAERVQELIRRRVVTDRGSPVAAPPVDLGPSPQREREIDGGRVSEESSRGLDLLRGSSEIVGAHREPGPQAGDHCKVLFLEIAG